jgi:hypothetical protein
LNNPFKENKDITKERGILVSAWNKSETAVREVEMILCAWASL